jgi:hypothetical protein
LNASLSCRAGRACTAQPRAPGRRATAAAGNGVGATVVRGHHSQRRRSRRVPPPGPTRRTAAPGRGRGWFCRAAATCRAAGVAIGVSSFGFLSLLLFLDSQPDFDGPISVSWPSSSGNPGMCRPWFARIINYVGSVAQLIRDLSSVKCSQTEALRLLLNSGSIASVPRKLGNRVGSLLRKMLSGTFLAVWGVVTEVIVFSKIALTRRRA